MNKKIKTLIFIIISLLIIFIGSNKCFGYYYGSQASFTTKMKESVTALQNFINRNPGQSAIGETLTIGTSTLEFSDYTYCIEHTQNLRITDFKVVKYLEITGGTCTEPTTGAKRENDNANRKLALILSRYENKYGAYPSASKAESDISRGETYTRAQSALYRYLNDWLEWAPGGTSNRTLFGFDASYGGNQGTWKDDPISKDIATKGDAILNELEQELADATHSNNLSQYDSLKVKLYFLESGNASYQKLIIAIPEINPKTELEVFKLDSKTDKPLPWVQFTIQNTDTGEYIRSVSIEDSVNHVYKVESYSTDLAYAGGFMTNINGHFKIVDLKPGNYELVEIVNPNTGYEKNVKGEENAVVETIYVKENQNNQITIYNEKEETVEPLPEPEPGAGNGNVTISGTVWEDQFSGKSNKGNAINGGEPGVEGVKVYWKTSSGSVIANTVTNKSGYYEMKTGIKIENHTYRISKSDWEKINNSYIEFEYNGLKYTTVATGASYDIGVSKAIENSDYRKRLDAKFSEITKDLVKDSDIQLNYKTTESHKSELEQILDNTADYSDFRVRADTKKIVDNLMSKYKFTQVSGNGDYCIKHCYYDGVPFSNAGWLLDYEGTPYNYETIIEGVDHNSSHKFYGGVAHCDHYHRHRSCHTYTGSDGKTHRSCHTTYTYCDSGHYTCGDVFGSAGHCLQSASRPNEWKITNMDLGLVKKEQPDLALTSDIDQVRVIMKGQEYTYKYNSRGITTPEDGLFDYKVKFSGKYDTEYRRPVNPSDIAYVNANGTDELQVYVKYKIIAKNQSTTLPVMVKEIVNYYDANYTIESSGWNDTSKYGVSYSGNGYKSAYTQQLDGTFIQPGQDSPLLEIEFRVNDDVVKKLIDGQDVLLHNVSEIHTYSSFYGTDTVCAEYKTASAKGWANRQYAGIDKDSIPGSAVPGKKDTYEDDTDQAPTFVLFRDPNYKIISGTVFEDTSVKTDGQRLGNGKNDGENKVANAKVELLRVLDDGRTELAKLYLVNGGSPQAVDAVTYTDGSGNYNFTGIVVDNYILRYTYGNRTTSSTQVDASDNVDQSILNNPSTINGHEINARNYKSTIITQEPVKSTMQGGGGDQWHLTTSDNTSTAVDYLGKRQAIESLKYSNFDTPINMTAYTKQFRVQVEYTPEQTNNVETDGVTIKGTDDKFKHEWPMFDFGIIERPREDIVIDKTISNIKITLANGQVLTEGSPYTEKLNYVKALGTKDVKTRAEATSAKEKFLYIEMDSELIQGARLDILYAITVTNNSEIDYEYDYNYGFEYFFNDSSMNEWITQDNRAYYYYYGQKTTPLIKPTVDWVVDYVDPELTCTVGDETNRDDVNKVNASKYTYQETNPLKDPANTTKIKDEDIVIGENYNWIQVKPITQADGTTKSPATQLREKGWISENTKNILEKENYLIFKTNYFYDVERGKSKTLNLFASKLLANQAEDYTYENHVEIVQINDKVARNIDSVNDGEQITKTYKPGNYMPSLKRIGTTTDRTLEQVGLHEQDDDMITIRITPPTGLENNAIIYIAVGAVALIVLAVGIYLIKKKVIG